MAPTWLTVVAGLYLSVCFCCAGFIAYDIFVNRRRQPMGVMNFVVFPITALYFGPLAVALYWHWGRAARATPPPMSANPAMASPTAASVGHGLHMSHRGDDDMAGPAGAGTGCAQVPSSEPDRPWWAAMAFQYFAIAPMRGLGVKDGLIAAAKADCISLTAFEVGLFGWMAVMAFVLFPAPHHLMPSTAAFWLLMQVGMMIGYFTSWPANVWLIKRGITGCGELAPAR
jgi:hypothetical protein